MSTVTYKHQLAIHRTRGAVPADGNDWPYQVTKILWPGAVEDWISARLLGRSLHVCAGLSRLGDVRLDLYAAGVDLAADAARLPFAAESFDTVLCDPPYNGRFQWNHDVLSELARVAARRIIFQHWFLPFDRHGRYKKDHRFCMNELATWPPKSYFGRVQMISILDRAG